MGGERWWRGHDYRREGRDDGEGMIIGGRGEMMERA